MVKTATRLSRKISIEEGLAYLRGTGSPQKIEGYWVSIHSMRMTLFSENTDCVRCGLKGEFFVVEEQQQGKPYLNLYAYGPGHTTEVLMTRDHIVALADGGSNELDNSQTMCSPCNGIKGSHAHEVQTLACAVKRKARAVLKKTAPMELNMFNRLINLQKEMGEPLSLVPSNDDYKTYMALILKRVRKDQEEELATQQRAAREVRQVQKRKRA